MTIEIAVISAESIKPSSPTPKSHQKHRLSFLDQLMHSTFSSFVYFYSSNSQIPNSQKSTTLKKTLSEVLSIYYPLAGRLVGNLYVDCNDGGVPFSEAEAHCDLSQVITDRDPTSLKKFLPYNTDGPQDFCMAVQATYFCCGGLAVGILILHKIADALSFISFAKTWSAAARNGHLRGPPPPKFDAAAYFPPLDITAGFQPTKGLTEDEVTARIFTFPSSKIAALQEKYSGGGGGRRRRTSRSEAMSAYIWTQFVSATGIRSDPDKICIVQNVVNLRTRADPPLSEYHFGNIVWAPPVKAGAEDSGFEIVGKVREAVKAIDDGYVARLQNSEKLLENIRAVHQAYKGEVVRFVFTNICGFPLYEADFGWGRPDRVGLGGFPFKNTVILMDTKCGGGIEALITLTKQDMEKLEATIEMQMLKSNL